MIHPNFLDEEGVPVSNGIALGQEHDARMHILARESVNLHKSRMTFGTRFNCHEGSRVVAKGKITQLSGLSD
jgi:hypothetical protein